jgi:hypothetical protein
MQGGEIQLPWSDKLVTLHDHFVIFFAPQPQSWPHEDLGFFRKKILAMKIPNVTATIPNAAYVCQSMILEAHQRADLINE